MILVDANILVYAHFAHMPSHGKAVEWLNERLNGSTRLGLPWQALLTFVRVASNPRAFQRPESVEGAWDQVEEWLDRQSVWIPKPSERHREIFGSLLRKTGSSSNLVPDAHLAALAIEHGLILCSTDGDFARFPGLKWENPLSGWRLSEAKSPARRGGRRAR